MRVCLILAVMSLFVVGADAAPRWPCNMGQGQVQCNGHGTCTHHPPGVPGLFCACDPGWTGEQCETDVDECAADPSPCDPRAACTNTPAGSYTCTCQPDLTGDGTATGTGCTRLCPSQCVLGCTYVGCGPGSGCHASCVQFGCGQPCVSCGCDAFCGACDSPESCVNCHATCFSICPGV